MERMLCVGAVALAVLSCGGGGGGGGGVAAPAPFMDLSGDWIVYVQGGSLTLAMNQAPDGSISGTGKFPDVPNACFDKVQLDASLHAKQFNGFVFGQGNSATFTGKFAWYPTLISTVDGWTEVIASLEGSYTVNGGLCGGQSGEFLALRPEPEFPYPIGSEPPPSIPCSLQVGDSADRLLRLHGAPGAVVVDPEYLGRERWLYPGAEALVEDGAVRALR